MLPRGPFLFSLFLAALGLSSCNFFTVEFSNNIQDQSGSDSENTGLAVGIQTSGNTNSLLLEDISATKVKSNDEIQIHFTAAKNSPLKIEWLFNGSPIGAGANQDHLSFNLTSWREGEYQAKLILGNLYQLTSKIQVTPDLAPSLVNFLPDSLSIATGSYLRIEAQVQGSFPLEFQWMLGDVAINGATSATLELPSMTNSGLYSVRVKNAVGEKTFGPVNVSVNPVTLSPAANVTQRMETVLMSTDPFVAQQIVGNGTRWKDFEPTTPEFELSYSFLASDPGVGDITAGTFSPINATFQSHIKKILHRWEGAAKIKFIDVSPNAGQISFGSATMAPNSNGTPSGVLAFAYPPQNSNLSGVVILSKASPMNLNKATLGDLDIEWGVVLHELGHAVLDFTDIPSNGNNEPGFGDAVDASIGSGTTLFTVMSYVRNSGNINTLILPSSPMLLDHLSAQHMYGKALTVFNPPNCEWTYNLTRPYQETLVASSKNCQLNTTEQTEPLTIDLRSSSTADLTAKTPHWSFIGEALATTGLYANKNLIILPETQPKSVIGGKGNDRIIANQNSNTLRGGLGDDTYVAAGDVGNLTLFEKADEGSDTLDLSALTNITLVATIDEWGDLVISWASNKITIPNFAKANIELIKLNGTETAVDFKTAFPQLVIKKAITP